MGKTAGASGGWWTVGSGFPVWRGLLEAEEAVAFFFSSLLLAGSLPLLCNRFLVGNLGYNIDQCPGSSPVPAIEGKVVTMSIPTTQQIQQKEAR